jgi:CheY-like chemotaxis protein
MTNQKTLLLVEDDPIDAQFILDEFNTIPGNFQIRVVDDGLVAMQYLIGTCKYSDRQRYPVPDLILLDLQLPYMNGFQFLEWLRTQASMPQRVIPVVVVAGSRLPEHVTRVYELGANAYLFKPVDAREFKESLAAIGTFWTRFAEMPRVASRV